MKISKEDLKRIIKEGLEQASVENTEERDMKGKAEFAKKLKDLSLQISKMKLDSKEIQAIDSILAALFVFANENSGGSKLSTLQDKLKPILGIK